MPRNIARYDVYGTALFNGDDIQSNACNKTQSINFEIQFMSNSSQDQKDDEGDIIYLLLYTLLKKETTHF